MTKLVNFVNLTLLTMRQPNLNLQKQILENTLSLLQEKEPYEIGMRDIAKKCNVTATTIYLYYKDKNDLFRHVSLFQLQELQKAMSAKIDNARTEKDKVIASLKAFRDWCFENPKTAMLFMGKIDIDPEAGKEELEKYYCCNRLGQELLEACIKTKTFTSKDSVMDTNVFIYSLWGCIESILRGRADTKLWDKSIAYTDRCIELLVKALEK